MISVAIFTQVLWTSCLRNNAVMVALFGFVKTARLRSRAGEERKTLAIATVTDGDRGEPDCHEFCLRSQDGW